MAYNQTCILIQNCVGIGTDTPLGSLTVKQTSTDGGATGGISIINDNNELKGSLFAGGSAPRPYGHLLLRDASNNDGVMLRTTGASNFILQGDLGIGTSSPSGYGHGGTNRILEIFNSCTSANAQSHIILTSGATTNPGSFGSITWAGSNYSSTNRAGIIAVSTETGATTIPQSFMQFYTSDGTSGILERMRITSTGNVGIGVSSPTIYGGGLEVGGRSQTGIRVSSTSGNAVELGSDSGWSYIQTTTAGQSFVIYTGAAQGPYMVINCAGKVGIGCTTPTNTLEVNGTGRFACTVNIGTSASSASRFQLNFQNWNTSNSYPYITFQNPAANCRHGIGINTSDNFVIGRATGVDCNFAHQDFVIVNSTGNVGINCITPSYKLHVNGTFYAAGSSQDYKQSICNYNTDSCMFMKLKPVTYQYKEEYCHLGKELKSGTQIGLIAEEVAESHPELAILVNEEDNKVVRNVDYEKLTIILLSELQKLRQEVDQLKNK